MPDLTDTNKWSDTVLTDLISEFENIAEMYLGVAFVSRTVTGETHYLQGQSMLRTYWKEVTAVSSITVTPWQSTTQTLSASDLQIHRNTGDVFLGSCYSGVAVISYMHGYATTPAPILRACREYVRSCALRDYSTVGRDVIAQSVDGGGTTRYSTPDWNAGRPTGYIEVDRLLNSQDNRSWMLG